VRERSATTIGGDGRLLTGTAAATAATLRVNPVVVRLGFVLLAIAGGWGVLLYLAAWGAFAFAVPPPPARPSDEPADPRRDLGAGLVVIGLVIQARLWGFAFSDAVVWPVAVLLVGLAVGWRRLGTVEVAELIEAEETDARATALRIVAGGVLAVGGLVSIVGAHLTLSEWARTMVGLVAVVAGVAVILGPTLRILSTALVSERRQRIRADERAVISSHLHDSVLQTLALIQKRSLDPSEVQALARRQERELRQWLYGDREARAGTVRAALEDAAAEVEDLHRVAVECVVVGDRPLDPRSEATALAAREAMVNAAKFSGEHRVSVYAEVGADELEVFVRDRGVGFDPSEVAADRRGIAESIVARMDRVGGTASVRSAPGEGTEVRLRLGGRP
jgi:signal transduction histidine kinase/phage shock protein PspC (stress-responsive transcriptional regulator)